MHSLSQLWLPILLSAVAVFLASSVIHMASPWHKSDYPKMPNEDAVMDALRPLAIPPGDYFFPRPDSMAHMKSPEFAERVKRGPRVLMTVMRSEMSSMGPMLAQWFVYSLVVSALAGHIASLSMHGRISGGHVVFHTATLVAFAAYSLALAQHSIWYSRSWSITLKSMIDGAIYAAITGAIFQWLWPSLLSRFN